MNIGIQIEHLFAVSSLLLSKFLPVDFDRFLHSHLNPFVDSSILQKQLNFSRNFDFAIGTDQSPAFDFATAAGCLCLAPSKH